MKNMSTNELGSNKTRKVLIFPTQEQGVQNSRKTTQYPVGKRIWGLFHNCLSNSFHWRQTDSNLSFNPLLSDADEQLGSGQKVAKVWQARALQCSCLREHVY